MVLEKCDMGLEKYLDFDLVIKSPLCTQTVKIPGCFDRSQVGGQVLLNTTTCPVIVYLWTYRPIQFTNFVVMFVSISPQEH